jgi:hypothetical protein
MLKIASVCRAKVMFQKFFSIPLKFAHERDPRNAKPFRISQMLMLQVVA